MDVNLSITLSGVLVVIIIGLVIFKVRKNQVYSLKNEKVRPKVSLVLVVKNNEKILKNAVSVIIKERKDIEEILVMDLGSIDGTIEIIRELMEKDSRIKLLEIVNTIITENYFSIIRGQVHGEAVLVLDLYKLGVDNPNVYVPNLFKPLDDVLTDKIERVDERIDGNQLLYLDKQEREKNRYILKEYVTNPLMNIHIGMEKLLELMESGDSSIREQGVEIKNYIENTINELDKALKLMSPIRDEEETSEENLISLFKSYGEEHRVSINYKILGTRVKLRGSISDLIKEITENLLYTVIQYNLSSDIDVLERYSRNSYELLFKYQCICDEKTLLDKDNGLSHYVIHSLQNKLNLVGGRIRIRVKPQWMVNILIQLPLDNTTLY